MRFIEFNNGMKFLVIREFDYKHNHYLQVASVTEDVKYFFLWQKNKDVVEFVEDGELLLELTNLIAEDLTRKINKK